jgi:hypothetical protein
MIRSELSGTGGGIWRLRELTASTSHATPPPPLVEPKVNTTGFAVLVNMYVGILLSWDAE